MYNQEIWKDIPGHEGHCQVSNFGNVRNLIRPWQRSKSRCKGSESYPSLTLAKEGKLIGYLVHRLVAQAFIPNPYNLAQVNHLDGNRRNNHISNLEWCNASRNLQHAYEIGLRSAAGEKNNNAKLTWVLVKKIRRLKTNNPGLSNRKIALMFNVSKNSINAIINNTGWIDTKKEKKYG